MIAQQTTATVNSKGVRNTVTFGIKQEGLAHIFNVLRNQLYSNKHKAVLREYATNAVDAHIEAGIPERPIEVTLPSSLNYNLTIRDFGNGLTEKEVEEVYCFYGESTKRNTNSQTGMLGIGSKSAFAYGDNFVINSFVGGVKHVYNAFIDVSKVGQISKLGEEKSNEESGVEIVIPVNKDDIKIFSETAVEIFQYFKVRPIIKGASIQFDKREAFFKADGWKWLATRTMAGLYHNGGSAVVVMGGIGYPIDFHSLDYKGEDYAAVHAMNRDNLVIYVEIGDLEISASREQLQYTEYTKKNLAKKLQCVRGEIAELVSKEFSNCKTLFEAKSLLGSLMDFSTGLYDFYKIVQDKIVFNGKKVLDSSFAFNSELVSLKKFASSRRSRKLVLNDVYNLSCATNVVVVLNDKNENRNLTSRLLPLQLEEKKVVYLVTYKNFASQKQFNSESSFDPPTVRKLSELPNRKLSEFEGYARAAYVRNIDGTHTAGNCFTLNWEKLNVYIRRSSDFWDSKSIDFKNEGGVYVLVDRFNLVLRKNSNNHMLANLSNWNVIQKLVESFGASVPEVIGIRVRNEDKVKDNKKWVSFETWLENFLIEKTNIYAKQFANSKVLDSISKLSWFFSEAKKVILLRKGLVDPLSPMSRLCDIYIDIARKQTTSVKIREVESFMLDYKMEINYTNADADFGVSSLIDEVAAKYELLKYIDNENLNWKHSEEFNNSLANYINVIDVCNAKKS